MLPGWLGLCRSWFLLPSTCRRTCRLSSQPSLQSVTGPPVTQRHHALTQGHHSFGPKKFKYFSRTISRPIPATFYQVTLDVSGIIWKLAHRGHSDSKQLKVNDFQDPLTSNSIKNFQKPILFSRNFQGLEKGKKSKTFNNLRPPCQQ